MPTACSWAEAELARDEGVVRATEEYKGERRDLQHVRSSAGGQKPPQGRCWAEAGGSYVGSPERGAEACGETGQVVDNISQQGDGAGVPWGSQAVVGQGPAERATRPGAGYLGEGGGPVLHAPETGHGLYAPLEMHPALALGPDGAARGGESVARACSSGETGLEGDQQAPAPLGTSLGIPSPTLEAAEALGLQDLTKLQAHGTTPHVSGGKSPTAHASQSRKLQEHAVQDHLNSGQGYWASTIHHHGLQAQGTDAHLGRNDSSSACPMKPEDSQASGHAPVPKRHRAMPSPLQCGAEPPLFGAAAIRARYPSLFTDAGVAGLGGGASQGTHVNSGENSAAVGSLADVASALKQKPHGTPVNTGDGLLGGGTHGTHVDTGEHSAAAGSSAGSVSAQEQTPHGTPVGSGETSAAHGSRVVSGLGQELGLAGVGIGEGSAPVGCVGDSQSLGPTSDPADGPGMDSTYAHHDVVHVKDVRSGEDWTGMGLAQGTNLDSLCASSHPSLHEAFGTAQGLHKSPVHSGDRASTEGCAADMSSCVPNPVERVEPSPCARLPDGSKAPALGLPACRARAD
jgi:hypothetical protein